jgi:hypothetical protein
MTDIVTEKGDKLGEIELSEKQLALLEEGATIGVIYHTPQLLRGALGEASGQFVLRKDGDRIVAADTETVRKFAALRAAIKTAREMS